MVGDAPFVRRAAPAGGAKDGRVVGSELAFDPACDQLTCGPVIVLVETSDSFHETALSYGATSPDDVLMILVASRLGRFSDAKSDDA